MSANRPSPDRTGDYGRPAVEHVLAVADWRGWHDMLEWLRGEGPNDPELNPDEFRGIRQDAERAQRTGAPFTEDPDRLWSLLRRHHTGG